MRAKWVADFLAVEIDHAEPLLTQGPERFISLWVQSCFTLPISASSIQFFFSGMGARSSSSLERNSLRIGELFALL
jgi:hypothetical protein